MTIFDLLPNNPFRSRRVSDVESRVAEPVITSTNAVGNKPVVHDGGEVLLVYSSNEKVLPIYKINQKINTTSRKLNRLAMISKYLFVILFFNFIAAYTSIAYVGLRHDQLDTSITKACVNGCNSTKVVGINARSLKVGGTPGDAFTLIKLGKLYENRTAEHNAFMDAHLPALLEEVTNITTTVANAVGFSAPELTDLPSALDSATSFAGQMDVIRNLLLELAAVPDAGSPQPSGLLELTQSLVDHFMDINNESDDYEKFVSNLNSTINEFKESHPAFSNLVVVKPDGDDTEPKTLSVRSLTLFNSTSTSPGGPVPAMNDILDSLFPGMCSSSSTLISRVILTCIMLNVFLT